VVVSDVTLACDVLCAAQPFSVNVSVNMEFNVTLHENEV